MIEGHKQKTFERETGLEPATFSLARRRSSQLSYSRDLDNLINLLSGNCDLPAWAGRSSQLSYSRDLDNLINLLSGNCDLPAWAGRSSQLSYSRDIIYSNSSFVCAKLRTRTSISSFSDSRRDHLG